jgi:ribosome-associated protein
MKYENLIKFNIEIDQLLSEITLKAVHSSGKGGQNVNKVASKVILTFNLLESTVMSLEIINELKIRLKTRLTKNNEIHLTSSKERSQYLNKQLVIKKFLNLINENIEPFTVRIKTKPNNKSVEKRLKDKLQISKLKKIRKPLKNEIE